MPVSSCEGTSYATTPVRPESLGFSEMALHPRVTRVYARGNLSLLQRRRVAIVGSRRASAQGVEDARWFAQSCVRAGLVVVSGLAVGVDAAAHSGALQAGEDSTIAVLAHGLDQIYPPRNTPLATRILACGGLLLSEYPDSTPARPFQFLHRNRIIAALSDAVCVVESGLGSGSLVTALVALELGKEVCATPGSIHSPLHTGSHSLIRQGACLVSSPEEFLMELGILTLSTAPVQASVTRSTGIDPRVQRVLAGVDWQPQTTEEIAQRLGFCSQEVLVGLLLAESLGLAKRLANGDWVRFRDRP